jgi:hypothetical protein
VPPPPQAWTSDELAADAALARREFVGERLTALASERRVYEGWIEEYSRRVQRLLDATSDLRNVTAMSIADREVLDTSDTR